MDFEGKNRRGEVPVSSHHIGEYVMFTRLISSAINLDDLDKVLSARFLHQKVTFPFPFSIH